MTALYILYYTMLCYTILHYTILHYTIRYYTILYYTIIYYTVLYCTILYYTRVYYTILCYTILYCTILRTNGAGVVLEGNPAQTSNLKKRKDKTRSTQNKKVGEHTGIRHCFARENEIIRGLALGGSALGWVGFASDRLWSGAQGRWTPPNSKTSCFSVPLGNLRGLQHRASDRAEGVA